MGKILEAMGTIDGYDVVLLGKIRAKKDKLFEEIVKEDKKIKEEVRKVVSESNGRVFAIIKKGSIKGIYLFEVEEKDGVKTLKHIKTVNTKEISKETKEKCDKYVLNHTKEFVSMQEYDKVTFEDNVVQVDPKKTKKEQTLSIISGFAVGFVLGWVCFDDVALGLLYGVIFSTLFGAGDVVITNKKKNKKKEDK